MKQTSASDEALEKKGWFDMFATELDAQRGWDERALLRGAIGRTRRNERAMP